jgi:hypothetical protein
MAASGLRIRRVEPVRPVALAADAPAGRRRTALPAQDNVTAPTLWRPLIGQTSGHQGPAPGKMMRRRP